MGEIQLWHGIVVPARQGHMLAGQYENPMQELTLSTSQGLWISRHPQETDALMGLYGGIGPWSLFYVIISLRSKQIVNVAKNL